MGRARRPRRRDPAARQRRFVSRVFDAIGSSRPVNLDRKGKIVVLDALWGLSESSKSDPQLSELQDKLKDEITAS